MLCHALDKKDTKRFCFKLASCGAGAASIELLPEVVLFFSEDVFIGRGKAWMFRELLGRSVAFVPGLAEGGREACRGSQRRSATGVYSSSFGDGQQSKLSSHNTTVAVDSLRNLSATARQSFLLHL